MTVIPMAPRPLWQGYLRLSLVSCPVALYGATNKGHDVAFHMLHKKTHNRIRMIPNDPDLGPVDRSDLVKGYEFQKNKYVIVTKDELDAVRLESTRAIDIEEFVDAADIDRIYWKEPYYLVPTGKAGTEAFGVIREAMKASGKIGLGRIVLHTRERVIAVEPRGAGMLVTTLRSNDEVRDADEVFGGIAKTKPDKKMLEIADKIIAQQAGDFTPKDFTDSYEAALREIIRKKQKGQPVTPANLPAEDDGKVVDLMEALKRSLGGKGAAKKDGKSAPAQRRVRGSRHAAAKSAPRAAEKPSSPPPRASSHRRSSARH